MRTITSIFCLLLSSAAWSQLPVVGEPLSAIDIESSGSIEIAGDELEYQPWSSISLSGTPVYLQHMAARSSSQGMNKALDNAIESLDYTAEQLRSVAIVNRDDAVWGTGAFVSGQLKKNKQRYPDSVIVQDDEGTALQQWQLQPQSVAVILLSEEGEVLFFKEGKLNEDEVAAAVALVKGQVE